ncbi:MAG: energy transducer TonB, partial [Candidatus Eremiobacteraeota bacterium]|nr:energy transducer TonB [Candidatus Eremiobacteraeota bacterium]
LAYDQRAEGTAVFDVAVDDRGTPQKCTITKTSSYMVLDVAVCKAAMNVRYSPKLINGKPVPGTYHDAFTFRLNDDQ